MPISEQRWLPATKDLLLTRGEVHVWRASLSPSPSLLAQLSGLLSPDEQERAARFHFDRDRSRFVAARGVLRMILGDCLHTDPAALQFQYEKSGKPDLAAPHQERGLCFNVTHSGDWALYALTLSRRIGIDLEHARVMPEMLDIAQRFFAPEEFAELCSLPAELQPAGFFRCWTRKEAYLKAIGEGLGVPLDQFIVSLAPEQVTRIVSILGDAEEASRWSLRELSVPADYFAALVVEGHDWHLSCWDWTEPQYR